MSGNGRRSARSRIKSSTDVDEFDRRRNSKPDRKVQKDRIGDHSFIRILNVNIKALLGFVVLAFFIILFLILHLMKPVEDAQRPRVVTPFPAPKIMDLPQVKLLSIFQFFFSIFKFFFETWWIEYCSSKASTRRACIGEHIALRFILEFVPGITPPACLIHNTPILILV